MDRVAALPITGWEKPVLIAAVRWSGVNGEVYPSLANWSAMAGLSVRSLQRILRRLVAGGHIEIVRASKGGTSRGKGLTSEYRVPLFVVNPDAVSGIEPRPAQHITPTLATPNPDTRDVEPRHRVTRSSNDPPNNQPTTSSGVVVDLLSPELLRQPNATPERLEWIAREAPSKDDPRAWAACAIRGAWNPTTEPPEAAAAGRQIERNKLLAEFDAMPDARKAELRSRVRRKYPNLKDQPDDSNGVRGGVARLMAEDRGG